MADAPSQNRCSPVKLTEPHNPSWEGVNGLTISGNGMGDVGKGIQEMPTSCWCRSSGVKGMARPPNPRWENDKVESGSWEEPVSSVETG